MAAWRFRTPAAGSSCGASCRVCWSGRDLHLRCATGRVESCVLKSAGLNSRRQALGRKTAMRHAAAGLVAALILGSAAPGFAQSIQDEIQNDEQPGSEIGIQIGG